MKGGTTCPVHCVRRVTPRTGSWRGHRSWWGVSDSPAVGRGVSAHACRPLQSLQLSTVRLSYWQRRLRNISWPGIGQRRLRLCGQNEGGEDGLRYSRPRRAMSQDLGSRMTDCASVICDTIGGADRNWRRSPAAGTPTPWLGI